MTRTGLNRVPLTILLLLALAAGFVLVGVLAPAPVRALPELDIAPDVVSVSPVDKATEVSLTSNVSVTFDRTMKADTINEDSFYLTRPLLKKIGDIYLPLIVRVDAVVTVAADAKSAKLDPVESLDPGVKYTAHLTEDILGRHIILPTWVQLDDTPYTWEFTTIPRPEIIAKTPGADATNVPLDQEVEVTFSRAVTGVGPDSFYLKETSSGVKLAGAVAYNPGTFTAVLTPLAPLDPTTNYTVTITSTVKSLVGTLTLENAPITWKFTTGAGSPVVTALDPADGAANVAVSKVITATFSQAMNASTINAASFFVKKSGGSPLAATVTYSAATQTASLDPEADLEYSTTYLVTLTGAVEGAAGDGLDDAPFLWSFTTAAEPEPEPSVFTDVSAGHPYHDAIYGMRDAGIINGYQVGDTWEFRPGNTVLRAQFTKMICGAMDLTVVEADWPDPSVPFTDPDLAVDVLPGPGIVDSLYPHEYIAVAYLNQITNGLAATTFGPYVGITRAQVVTMIVRAVQTLHPVVLLTPPAGYAGTLGNFDSLHGPNMKIAEHNGLLAGLVGFTAGWNPWAPGTRGETAQMLWNLIGILD